MTKSNKSKLNFLQLGDDNDNILINFTNVNKYNLHLKKYSFSIFCIMHTVSIYKLYT